MGVSRRIFGSNVDPKIKQKIEDLQNLAAVGADVSDSVLNRVESNFKGAGELSSRTPFVRMWTCVQTMVRTTKSTDAFMQLSAKHPDFAKGFNTFKDWFGSAKEDNPKNRKIMRKAFRQMGARRVEYKKDTGEYIVTTDLNRQIYMIGPNADKILEQNPGGTIMTPAVGQTDQNVHFAVQAGIQNVDSSAQGPLGLTKKTTVNFIVGNMHDMDTIYSKYFLRPGAMVFVDFGWDTANHSKGIYTKWLYNPQQLIADSESTGYSLEELLFNDPDMSQQKQPVGIIPKADGDAETVVGYVTDYQSTLKENGTYDCQLTIVSANSALTGATNSSQKQKESFFNKLDAEIVNFAAQSMRSSGKLTQHSEKATFLDPNKSYSTNDIDDWNEYARLFAAQNLAGGSGGTINTSTKATKIGVFYYAVKGSEDSLDPPDDASKLFISIGLLEDLILNQNLSIGKAEDVQQGKNFAARFNSSNNFTRFDENLLNAQKHGKHQTPPSYVIPNEWTQTYNTVREQCADYRRDEKGHCVQDKYLTSELGGNPNDPTYHKRITWTEYDKERGRERLPIRELFVNLALIKAAFLGHDTVDMAMKQILDKINEDSHHIFDLTLYSSDKADSEISIIDRHQIEMQQLNVGKMYGDAGGRTPSSVQAAQAQAGQTTAASGKPTAGDYFNSMLIFKPGSPQSIVKNYSLNMNTPKNGMQNMIAIQGSSPDAELTPYSSELATQLSLYLMNQDPDSAQYGFTYLPDMGDDTIARIMDQNEGGVKMGDLGNNDTLMGAGGDAVVKSRLQSFNKSAYMKYTKHNPDVDSKKAVAYRKAYNKAANIETDDEDEDSDPGTVSPITNEDYGPNWRVVNSIVEFYKLLATSNYFGNQNMSAIMPLKLKLTIHGLQGLQNGDVFRIDYLPKRYKDVVYFQIMKVNHKISSGGWSTDLESVMRIRSDAKMLFHKGGEGFQKITEHENNIILGRSIINQLNVRMDNQVLKNSSVKADEFVDSIRFMRFKRSMGFQSPSQIDYMFQFKCGSSSAIRLSKYVSVPKSGDPDDDYKYSTIFLMDSTGTDGPSYWMKGEDMFTFGMNGTLTGSKTSFENVPSAMGLPARTNRFKGGDKWNTKFKEKMGTRSASPNKVLFTFHWSKVFSYTFSTGIAEQYNVHYMNTMMYPGKQYWFIVRGHDFVVLPIEAKPWMINRVDNMWAWHFANGHRANLTAAQ